MTKTDLLEAIQNGENSGVESNATQLIIARWRRNLLLLPIWEAAVFYSVWKTTVR